MKSTLLLLKAISLLLSIIFLSNKIYGQAGTLDVSFGDEGKDTIGMLVTTETGTQKEQIQKLLLQKNQKIVAAGFVYHEPRYGEAVALTRFNTDGSIDKTFGKKGKELFQLQQYGAYCNDAALQSDDKIIVAGQLDSAYHYPLLMRFTKNGLVDTSFAINGFIDTTNHFEGAISFIGILSDNSIVVTGGEFTSSTRDSIYSFVSKYFSNGVKDSAFGINGDFTLNKGGSYVEPISILIQPDHKILINASIHNDTSRYEIIRLTSSGKYDLSFGDSGKIITGLYNQLNYNDTINKIPRLVGLLNDGKIITRSSRGIFYYSPDELTRYKSNGTIDSGFGLNGIASINDNMNEYSIIVQPDNKIIFGGIYGDTTNLYSYSNFAVSRFNEDGTLDKDFGNNGLTITDFGVYSKSVCSALQKDSKILLGGNCFRTNEDIGYALENFALTRYNNDNILPLSFLFFNATKQAQSVLLNWQTTNEINNNYFSAERSNNNKNFNEINKVYCTNNPSKINSYNTTDLQPLKGWNYYRLKQVDKDGKFSYSSIASVFFDKGEMVSIYPNPANNFIYVDGLKEGYQSNITITDANGKTIATANTSSSQYKIDLQKQVAGIYYINITRNGKTIKQKLIKQ